jgi:hypothetical protein
MDELKALEAILPGRQSQHTHIDQAKPVVGKSYQSKAHNDRTRIDAQNYFRLLLQREDYF